MLTAFIVSITLFLLPSWLISKGLSSLRIAILCLIVGLCALGVATVFGDVGIGPHIDCPGWFLGAVFATALWLSCGFCLTCRRLFRPQGHGESVNAKPHRAFGKFMPHLLWLLGLIVVFFGITVGPGVPSQDLSPVMRAMEEQQVQRSMAVALAGLCLFTGGVYWAISGWVAQRYSRKTFNS